MDWSHCSVNGFNSPAHEVDVLSCKLKAYNDTKSLYSGPLPVPLPALEDAIRKRRRSTQLEGWGGRLLCSCHPPPLFCSIKTQEVSRHSLHTVTVQQEQPRRQSLWAPGQPSTNDRKGCYDQPGELKSCLRSKESPLASPERLPAHRQNHITAKRSPGAGCANTPASEVNP